MAVVARNAAPTVEVSFIAMAPLGSTFLAVPSPVWMWEVGLFHALPRCHPVKIVFRVVVSMLEHNVTVNAELLVFSHSRNLN